MTMSQKEQAELKVTSFLQKNPGVHTVSEVRTLAKVTIADAGEFAYRCPNIIVVKDATYYANMNIRWSGYAPYLLFSKFREWAKVTGKPQYITAKRTGLTSRITKVFKAFEPDVLVTKTQDEIVAAICDKSTAPRQAYLDACTIARLTTEFTKSIINDREKWWYL